jgi:hypothetical protein
MKSNPISFYRLIFLSLFGRIMMKVLNNNTQVSFPKKIGKYKFINQFYKNGYLQPFYQYGIYKDDKNNKAFAKMWNAPFKNYAYYTLKNEIIVYQILNNVINRTSKLLPLHLRNVHIPQIIDSKEEKQSLIILLEFIRGTNAESLKDDQKLEVYLKAVDFYRFISKNLTSKEQLLLSKRTARNYILIYPLILINAIINYPKQFMTFIKSIPYFVGSIPSIVVNKELVLTQRDLQFKNILINKKQIILIDLEMCVLTNPLAEYANTLRSISNQKKLFTRLLKEINKRFGFDESYKKQLSCLSVNITTHSLVDKKLPSAYLHKDVQFLKFLNNGGLLK